MTSMTCHATQRMHQAPASMSPLREVLGGLEQHDVQAILAALAADIDTATADLEQAADDGDAGKARRAAHRLAGLLGHCGYDETTALARHLTTARDDLALSLVVALTRSAKSVRRAIALLP